jgi:hypothetical protein
VPGPPLRLVATYDTGLHDVREIDAVLAVLADVIARIVSNPAARVAALIPDGEDLPSDA